MATTIENGIIVFGDATIKSTANFAWSGGSSSISALTSVPTQLSQFTNDLGNYGSFLTSAAAVSGNSFQNPNGALSSGTKIPAGNSQWGLTWNGSQVNLAVYNCNCVCNC